MDKQSIKNYLLEKQSTLVAELKEQTQTIHTMVDIDESDTIDPEDFSHQYESQEMEQMLKVQLNRAERGLEVLASLDITPKDKVETGAIIETDSLNFFIGYPTIPFDMENKRYVGISAGSPIYTLMNGKRSGDSFQYSGTTYNITKIF
ncbi:MAG: hypothetical protein DCO96_09285 [Fluviicola sp. XM-24bin1]|nr:MAG: hypothetical protein DCO96_09285 [Fluviicola sp. XM-24bin1]